MMAFKLFGGDFVLKLAHCVMKTAEFVKQMADFVLKMMNFVGHRRAGLAAVRPHDDPNGGKFQRRD